MHLVRFALISFWLYAVGGRRVLAFGLAGGLLAALLLFGSLIGSIAVSRGPLPHRALNPEQPQRDAGKVHQEQLGALGLHRQKDHTPVVRDWKQVREEQLKQLGLARQQAAQKRYQ